MDTTRHTLRNRILTFTMATVMAFGAVAGLGGAADAQVSSHYDASVDSTIADIQAFWTATMPSVYGQAYEAIPTDRVFAYSSSNPPPNCDDGGQTRRALRRGRGQRLLLQQRRLRRLRRGGTAPQAAQQLR